MHKRIGELNANTSTDLKEIVNINCQKVGLKDSLHYAKTTEHLWVAGFLHDPKFKFMINFNLRMYLFNAYNEVENEIKSGVIHFFGLPDYDLNNYEMAIKKNEDITSFTKILRNDYNSTYLVFINYIGPYNLGR